MRANKRKSKKRSDASSASGAPPELIFFIDKSLGQEIVPRSLRALGLRVERKTDHFPQDAPDAEWIREVGKRGWVILSKDKGLRHNHLEVIALLESGVPSFILTCGNATGEEMAKAFELAVPSMLKLIKRQSPPFVASVGKAGTVSLAYTFEGLIKKVGDSPSKPSRRKKRI